MQIQLKQAEIVAALKQYISTQGINLSGKTVDIRFTAGRRESGITADLVIEDSGVFDIDVELPEEEPVKAEPPKLVLTRSAVAEEIEPISAIEEPTPETPQTPKVATSLFS